MTEFVPFSHELVLDACAELATYIALAGGTAPERDERTPIEWLSVLEDEWRDARDRALRQAMEGFER